MWVMYWDQVEANSIAVTQPNLNAEKIKEFQIPLPPIDIQQKIVADMAVLEEKGAKAREKINEINNRIALEFTKLQNYESVLIDDISENLDYLRKPVTKGFRKEGNIPYYGASGVVDYVEDYLLDDYVLLIAEDGANLKSRTTPIAFTASGKIWVNNHAHILRFPNMSIHKIAEFYLNNTDISEYITGQAQPKLNQQNLNRIKIPLPSPTEQQAIATEIDTLEKEIVKAQEIINKIPEQQATILKKYL